MPAIEEKSAAIDELERRYGPSPELNELRRRYAIPKDEIEESKITEPEPQKQISYRDIYEKILLGEVDWDSYIPAEKREILRQFPDYEDNGKRLINSAYLSDMLGIDLQSAYITHDQLVKALLDEKTPKSAFARISNRFKNGKMQVLIDDWAYYDLIGQGDSEENMKIIDRLRKQITQDDRQDLRKLWEQMVGATSEQLPYMWEAIKASPKGSIPAGLAGGIAAFGVGALVPFPEEAYTVPSGIMLGIKVGGGIAAADRVRQLEAGGMYLELLEMKDENGNRIDPRIAKITAHAVGAINGAIELAEWAVLLETFGIGTKIFENAAVKVTSKLFAKGTLKHIAMKYSLKGGAALSAEVIQELEQESTNIVFGELAKGINNQTKGTDIKHITADDLKARYSEVMSESIKGFALLVAPGTIISGVRETITRKPPVKKQVKVEIPKGIEEKLVAPPAEKAVVQVYKEVKEAPIEQDFTAEETEAVEQLEKPQELYEIKRMDIKKIKRGGKEIEVAGRLVIYEKETGKEVGVFRKRKDAKARLAELNEAAKPITPKRPKHGYLTIKSTVEKIVSEYEALKQGLKKAARDARKAYSVGKAEGIAKIKEYYRELKEKDRQRKALKKRIDTAVKTIKKEQPKSVDFFYREAIDIIRQGIDPKFRTQTTLQKRQRMKDFLERATEEQKRDFPAKLAASLEKKDLGKFTVEELENIASEIQRLEKLGKTKQKARLATEEAQRERIIKQMAEAAEYVKPPEEQPKGIDFSPAGLTEAIKAGYLWTLRMPRILDWLDGRKGTFSGIWHRTFYDQISNQTDKELVMEDYRIVSGEKAMAELGITLNNLAEVTDFSELQEGLALTKQQQMGLYAALKNQLATDAVVNGNKIAISVANAVVSNLETKFKQLADYIINDYQVNYERLRNAHIENTNEDMGIEDFYSPMIRLEKNEYVTNEEIADQLLQRTGLKRGYAQKGFTIDRKNIAPEHQKPIDIRLVSVWQSQVEKQEHYIHFAKLIKDLRSILGDEKIKETIRQKLGRNAWKIIDNYLSRVANPNIYKGYDGLAGISRLLRGNVAIAYLAYNLLTIAKQIPSFVLYAKDAGMSAMISSISEFVKDPHGMWDDVRMKDPQVKNAFIERELAELRTAIRNTKDKTVRDKLTKLLSQVGDTGMIGIRFVDGIVRTIGWNAVYQKNLQLGLSEAEAIREAQNSTLRTQPAAAPKDIAQLYATTEAVNWFTMFTNQLNNIWNITTYDTYAYWKSGKYQAAAMNAMAVSVNALFIWMLVNKQMPDDDEDLVDAATDQVFNMLPLVGSGAMAGKRGWGTLTPPPVEIGKYYGKILSAKDKEKAALQALEKSLILTGVPITAIKRAKKFAETGEPIELIGGEKKKEFKL